MDENGRQGALQIVEYLQVRDAIDNLERAERWTVITRDIEFGTIGLVGMFENPGDALAYAASYGVELNQDSGLEDGWTVDVIPIMPADKLHDPRART